MLRFHGSRNSKHDTVVSVIQKWNCYRPSIKLLIGDFFAYLVDKRQRELRKIKHFRNITQTKTNTISWIEKLLQTSIKDGREYCLWRILCPYLVNVKKIGYEETFEILKIWLEKCNKLSRLDFNPNTEIRTKIRYVKSYLPISLSKLKTDNPDFFKTLQDMKILES